MATICSMRWPRAATSLADSTRPPRNSIPRKSRASKSAGSQALRTTVSALRSTDSTTAITASSSAWSSQARAFRVSRISRRSRSRASKLNCRDSLAGSASTPASPMSIPSLQASPSSIRATCLRVRWGRNARPVRHPARRPVSTTAPSSKRPETARTCTRRNGPIISALITSSILAVRRSRPASTMPMSDRNSLISAIRRSAI